MRETGGRRLEENAFRDGGCPILEMEFLVNGRNVLFLQDLDTRMRPEGEVAVLGHQSWAEVPFL
jgi:molybdopterin converting factor small subunit